MQRDSVPTETPSSEPLQETQVPKVTLGMGVVASEEAIATGSPHATTIEASKPGTVRWRAKEFISPDKNVGWYIGLGVVVVAVLLLDIFVMKAWTVSAVFIAIAVALIVMSVRPPREIEYTLGEKGVYVDGQLYRFDDYRAFGVMHDGKENSIQLIPVKRFRPGLSVYFPVESGEQIVAILGQKLPMQELEPDFVDKIVRILRL